MKNPRVSFLSAVGSLSAAALALFGVGSSFGQSVWSGTNGVWSSTTLSGWTTGGVPNGIGSTALFSGGLAGTTTQDIVSGVTVGTIDFSAGNVNRTISTGTNGLTFNQDGAGLGFATLSNSNSNTGSTNRISFNSSSLITLADDLLITNTGGSTSTGGSIVITGSIAGSGNLTLSNVSNNVGAGQIVMGDAGTFTGNVLVQKGAVTFNTSGGLGSSSNLITLGSSGSGSVTLVQTSANTLSNNITVAAGTGGTTVLGSTSASTTDSKYSGTITLNGDLSTTSVQGSSGTSALFLSGVVAGAGNLFANVSGTGNTRLTGNNTFTGDTRVVANVLQLGATSGTNSTALQNSTLDLNVADSGTVAFGINGATTINKATLGGLKGTRDLALVNSNTTAAAAVALSVGNNNSSNTYSGALSGAGSFIKIGTGTQTLSGANSYTGGTTVTAGTLLINGSNVGSAMTVSNAGSALGGTGTIAPGASHSLSVGSAATLAPGTDGTVGTLTVSLSSTGDAASFASGAKFAFDLAAPGTNDVLVFTGLTASSSDVTFNGNVINFTNIGGLTGGTYTLFTFDAALAYSGTLSIGTGLGGFAGSTLSYNTNSIVLNVVPEPATVALTGLGVAGMLYMVRRRRN